MDVILRPLQRRTLIPQSRIWETLIFHRCASKEAERTQPVVRSNIDYVIRGLLDQARAIVEWEVQAL